MRSKIRQGKRVKKGTLDGKSGLLDTWTNGSYCASKGNLRWKWENAITRENTRER
jgi:hypothetical protein